MKKFLVFLFVFIATGCAQITPSGYYWGDYSESYYQYIKSPSEETVKQHLDTLQDILTVSSEHGLKVPPGVYAEIGYIFTKQGEADKAVPMFAKEAELYPESVKFVKGLMPKEGA